MIRKVGAKRNEPSMDDRVGAGLATAVVAPMGGAILNAPISLWARRDLMRDQGRPNADSSRVAKHMKKKYGLKTSLSVDDGGRGPHYNPLTDSAHVRQKGPATMAHELGHAVDMTGKKRWVGSGTKMLLRTAGPGAGLLAAAGLMASGEKGSQYAAPAAAAGYAPMLFQEGKASVIGVKNIREVLGRKAARTAAKDLTKAFGTYAALPIGTAAAAHFIRRTLYPKGKPTNAQADKENAGF